MINKLKLTGVSLLSAAVVFGSGTAVGVNAAVDNIAFTDGMISVSGTTPVPNGGVTVSVYRDGADKSKVDNACYIDEILSDENAKYEIRFNLKDAAPGETLTGKYVVCVRCENEDISEKTFSYADYTAVLNQLIAAAEYTDVYSLLENESEQESLSALGLNMRMYHMLSDDQKTEFTKSLFSDGALGSDAKSVADKFNGNLAVALMNTNQTEYVKCGLELFENVHGRIAYSEISDESEKNFVAESIALGETPLSIAAVPNAYNCAQALYKINTAGVGAVDSCIRLYADILEIGGSSEYSKWTALEKDKLTSAARNLVTVLSSDKAKTVAALKNSMAAAIEQASSGTDGGTGSGNSGSSGSSSGSSGGRGSSGGSGSTGSGGTYTVDDSNAPSDIPSDIDSAPWAREAVISLCSKGIMSGYSDNTFRPNNPIKREELVKILVNAFGIKGNADIAFSDVGKSDWYYTYVSAAYAGGIVNGISGFEFGVSRCVTRQDAAAMLFRAAGALNIKLADTGKTAAFSDNAEISSYAAEAVDALCRAGVINGYGDNTFRPQENVTRAQAASMIYGVMKNIK